MIKKNKITEEVEKTLASFDDDIVQQINPFLITRIRAARSQRMSKAKKGLSMVFGLNQMLIIFILLINMVTVFYYVDRSAQYSQREELVSELEAEYHIDQSQYN